jgi:hypothetical protein
MTSSFVRQGAVRLVVALLATGGVLPPAPTTIAADATAVEPISVPGGSPSELLAFIADVKRRQPAENDPAAVTAHLVRVENAVIAAVEKIVAGSPDEQERIAAVSEKLSALMLLRRLEAPDAEARLKVYLDDVARDSHPAITPLGRVFGLATRLSNVDLGNHAEVENLAADVREHLRTARPDARNLSVAFQTALAAERAGLTKLAVELYRDFAEVFADSDNPAVVENAKKLSAAARLLSLPGNPLELQGTLLDGTPYDAKRYAGKTLLVVFGATWNGSFVAELPIVREAYAKYQDRGFEVVLVSLDDDRRRLDDFVKREQLTWPVLYGNEPDAVGWNHPLAAEYGIMSIPRAIFVGKDGKVASIDAHGEALWELLFRQLGPAAEPKPPADAAPAESPPAVTPEPKP